MIVVNFKRYPQATGDKAVVLARICQKVSSEYRIPIIPVPDLPDLAACIAAGIDCWTQKFEPQSASQVGTLLNHSDFRLDREKLREETYLSKSRGDKVCICTADLEESAELLIFGPNYLAFEPPALIGSKEVSVATEEPEVIGSVAKSCANAGIPLLVGAGIKSAEDIRVSLRYGAVGVLVASDIDLAADPEKELRELAQAFTMK